VQYLQQVGRAELRRSTRGGHLLRQSKGLHRLPSREFFHRDLTPADSSSIGTMSVVQRFG
jgi:hypothetical protein